MNNKENIESSILNINDVTNSSFVSFSDSIKGTSKMEVFNSKSKHFLDFEFFDIEDSQSGLITTTEVAQAFRKNKNHRIFAPASLEKSVTTVTDPYPIPIKRNHKDSDPIGRAFDAKYVPRLSKVQDKFSMYDALQPVRSTAYLNAVKNYIRSGLDSVDSFPGLGFLLVKGGVTDKDAIEKILDKRYLTVSLEAKAKDALDPLTGESILISIMEGKYKPGEYVEELGGVMPFVYDEVVVTGYAYVNLPASNMAKTYEYSMLDSELEKTFKDSLGRTSVHFNSGLKIEDSEIEEHFNNNYEVDMEKEKALLQYKEALNKNKDDFSETHARHLYGLIDSETVEEAFSTEAFKIKGLPIFSKKVYDEVSSIILESKDVVAKQMLEIVSNAMNYNEENEEDNRSDDTSNIIDHDSTNQKDEVSMNFEEIKENLTKLSDSDKNEVLSLLNVSDTIAEKDSKIKELESKVSEISQIEDQLKEKENLLKLANEEKQIFKNRMAELLMETTSLKAGNHNILDSTKAEIKELASLLQQMKLIEDLDLDLSISQILTKVKENLSEKSEKISEVIDSLYKETENEEVENPTKIKDEDDQEEEKVTFNSREIKIAKIWDSYNKSNQIAKAKNYIGSAIKQGWVDENFDPVAVINSISK